MEPAFPAARPFAVITGASDGIGRELAHLLAARKHDLLVIARRTDRLALLADELAATHGVRVETLGLDLAAPHAAREIAKWLDARDLVPDVLVNNAGYGLFGRHVETSLADELQMIALNVVTLTDLTKRLLPGMVARGSGRILHVASTAAFQPGPYMAVYYATKAYVLSYAEAVAEELAGTGVTVTAVCPGPTASGFQDRAAMHDSALVKGKRLPTAAEVADHALRATFAGRRVAVPGWRNRLLVQSLRVMPRRVVTHLVASMSRPVEH